MTFFLSNYFGVPSKKNYSHFQLSPNIPSNCKPFLSLYGSFHTFPAILGCLHSFPGQSVHGPVSHPQIVLHPLPPANFALLFYLIMDNPIISILLVFIVLKRPPICSLQSWGVALSWVFRVDWHPAKKKISNHMFITKLLQDIHLKFYN